MGFRQSPDEEAKAITRLVDEPAIGTEREPASAWADRPEIRRQVDAQRRVAEELRAGGPEVPKRLISTVEARVREAYGPGGARHRRTWSVARAGWRPAAAMACLAAVCAAVVIAVVGVGGGSTPSIPAAAKLAFKPSTGPAPVAKNATLLDVSYGGVTFPNYQKFAVHPTGRRIDRIGGRPALTVFYRLPGGTRLSYTVFSGNAVPLPAGTRSVVVQGVHLKEFKTSSGLSVVTLVRDGRTCVLAAPTKQDAVLSLAAAPVLAQASA